MNTEKGYDFEHDVESVLRDLEKKSPARVKVTAQRDFRDVPRPHRADFELEYKLGGLTHQHLIECQNRDRSSHEIADKIYAVRGTSDRNRYILVYRDSSYLSEPVAKRLKEMGVLCFDFESFKKTFVTQLEADIALHGIGLNVLGNPKLREILADILKGRDRPDVSNLLIDDSDIAKPAIDKKLFDSGSKYDYRRSDPPDRAMSSGR
jgi:hypothetical protein